MPRRRAHTATQGPPTPVGRGAAAASLHASVLTLHHGAGNRAVTGLVRSVQRKVGWSDADPTKGHAWNFDERKVGKVRRIPLEGLGEGLSMSRGDELSRRWVWDDPPGTPKRKGHWAFSSTRIKALSSEGAKGKAIVLVPEGLDATQGIEVLVLLHGFTEDESSRPFAGWRALDNQPAKPGAYMANLRKGIDAADVAPVRDVALDQAEQQLEESGQKQLVIVLPQGGLRSEFDKEGDMEFAQGPYVTDIVDRLHKEQRWKDAAGAVAKAAPTVKRVIMAGHSGAGAALSQKGAVPSDLVLYDAINGGQVYAFINWAIQRLDADLAVLTDKTKTDAEKLAYLHTAPKLRGYTSDSAGYIASYIQLDDAIDAWFKKNAKALGAFAGCLRANFTLDFVPVTHEELMRGSSAGSARPTGTGTIVDAIRGLHPTLHASTSSCPAMPLSLRDRISAAKAPPAKGTKAKAGAAH